MMRRSRLQTFALGAILCTACSGTEAVAPDPPVPHDGTDYVPGVAWRSTSPVSAGFDQAGLTRVRDQVREGRYGAIDAVLVVRYGYLVSEQYIGWQPGTPHTLQSVTKSVTSLLFGILQAHASQGTANLDRPVVEVLSRYAPVANLDQRKRALTLRHLLLMRTGMDFWEQPYPGSPLDQLNRSSGDWVKFVLDRPMTADPGSAWSYNSGAAIVTCGVIREIAGENADVFSRRELFAPLGITGETWYRSPFDGLPHCGGGLSLKPADLARIGYLVLRRGRWGDRQVVPEAWIDAAVQPVSRGNELIFSGFNPGYGYFWWIFPSERGGTDSDVIAASGSGGQWLFIVPRLDLVVTIAASNGAGLDLLYDLLPTVR